MEYLNCVSAHTSSKGSVERAPSSVVRSVGGLTGAVQPVILDKVGSVSAVGRGRGHCACSMIFHSTELEVEHGSR